MANAWLEAWPLLLNELGGMQTRFNLRRRSALIDMLGRPWFQRVWVVQEAFSARRASIACGWNTIPAPVFVLMPGLLEVETDAHVQSVLDILPGYLRESSWRSEQPNLRTLLKKFRWSRAKDPRDKIYALLGIASDAGCEDILQPDYGVPFRETIQQAVAYLTFRKVRDTLLCQLPDWDFDELVAHLDDLPSRVLDWALQHREAETAMAIVTQISIDVNGPHTPSGAPLLYLAEHGGAPTVIQAFFDRNDINVNVKRKDGNTPLNIAAREGRHPMVKLLLAHNDVDPNHCGGDGRTPLASAAEEGHDAVVNLLLERDDVDVNQVSGNQIQQFTPLWLAASKGRMGMVDLLFLRGADVENKDRLCGRMALYAAVESGHPGVAELLVQRGANIEEKESCTGVTPLWEAAKNGQESIVKLLLEKNANPKIENQRDQTALWIAASNGHQGTVRALLHKSSSAEFVERKDREERATALWVAAKKGHTSVVKALIEAGAEVQTTSGFGKSALWVAVLEGQYEIVWLLLEEGAQYGVEDWQRHSFLLEFLERRIRNRSGEENWGVFEVIKKQSSVEGSEEMENHLQKDWLLRCFLRAGEGRDIKKLT